ncbi:MAG TPA: NAD-dependent epimerase/dehydratase family protein [Polyangia bacterium]|jgi:UDP-glucose 4-epimerase
MAKRTPRDRRKTAPPRTHYDPEQRVVAVTGAHGFFGSQLIRRLEEDRRYYKILAIDIRKPEMSMDKTQFHRVDLTMPSADAEVAAVLSREGADTLVHAAFLYNPTHASAWAHELENIGTVHVLNAAAEVGLRKLVQWSLTAVYGAQAANPNYLTEDHPLHGQPGSRYLTDRVNAELEARRFRREHPEIVTTVLRTAHVLGPTIRNFVSSFFRSPVAPRLMGYDPLMQFVHEEDAVDAFKLAVDDDYPGEFNIVGEGVLPYTTVLAMLGRVPVPVPRFLATPVAHALWVTQAMETPPAFLEFLRFMCVADGTRARSVMGFLPRYDIRATINDFLGVEGEPDDFASAGGRP